MLQQYYGIKAPLPSNTLLLFRLGDFYELFESDAEEASRILGLTLTFRHGTPMAGIPYHAAEIYVNKLLRAGKKVGIADQMESATPGKLVKRGLTRILTPGTVIDDSQVDAQQNHYLFAIDYQKEMVHAAWLDLSTGQFTIATNEPENLFPIFHAIDPQEIILPESAYQSWKKEPSAFLENLNILCDNRAISEVPDYQLDKINGARIVMETMGVLNLEGFGIDKEHSALGAAGAVLIYATESLCRAPKNIGKLQEYQPSANLLLDPATLKNLEIFKSSVNTRKGSLIDALDRTVTSAGARLLERYLAAPLLDLSELHRRQQAVEDFLSEPGNTESLQGLLKPIRDIARIVSRLQNRIRNPRELGGIRDTLNQLPEIKATLTQFPGETIPTLSDRVHSLKSLRNTLNKGLNDELPGKLNEGGIIKPGYDKELDYMLGLASNNKTWISDLERAEQEKTGIKNLKVKFNGSFGYFIEVTKSNLNLVPEHYIRKQTMTNAERYYTEELKEKEKEILNTEDSAMRREEQLLKGLIEKALAHTDLLLETAEVLAEIDVFSGWAVLALEWDYCRPSLGEDDSIEIKAGRHPVVEQMLREDKIGLSGSHAFVPNDSFLTANSEQISLITGPNMAGKSTYIRQVALITLMAQIGCWVPAIRCHVGIVDRIFSRVGASDELARGNSTFMVEMNETANILNNATARSLIILDEIGRGTSTYDGLSIAWAVIEHLHKDRQSGPRTLFATHYHELTQLENTLSRLKNYSVAVKEWKDQIIFARQVMPGAADRSYGIQVAKLAGLPKTVINRAKVILNKLEAEGAVIQSHLQKSYSVSNTKPTQPKKKVAIINENQMSLL